MKSDFLSDQPKFVKEALAHFENIMSSTHQEQLGRINRTHRGELFVLKNLHMREQAITPSELSLAMDSSTARISALLRALEQKEQIERKVDKDDRRYVLVTITEQGKERVRREIGQMRENLAKVFVDLGPDNTSEFLRFIDLFLSSAKKHMAGQG